MTRRSLFGAIAGIPLVAKAVEAQARDKSIPIVYGRQITQGSLRVGTLTATINSGAAIWIDGVKIAEQVLKTGRWKKV